MGEIGARVERDKVAQRLIAGSVKRSYDWAVDIDWDAPLEPDLWFMPPEAVSLYGTRLWEQMSEERRRELARQEIANTLSRGVWFENTLNQGLLMHMLFDDPTSRHVHYALTELGDETRHMIMFGRAVSRIGARPYRLSRLQALAVQLFPVAYRGIFLYVAALVGEEWLDQAQRKYMNDVRVQPLIRRVMQIHVTEEARHIRFAREGVKRQIKNIPRWQKTYARYLNGFGAFVLHRMSINREVYRRCGLNSRKAARQAMANEHHVRQRREFFANMHKFFEEQGLVNWFSRPIWRYYKFL